MNNHLIRWNIMSIGVCLTFELCPSYTDRIPTWKIKRKRRMELAATWRNKSQKLHPCIQTSIFTLIWNNAGLKVQKHFEKGRGSYNSASPLMLEILIPTFDVRRCWHRTRTMKPKKKLEGISKPEGWILNQKIQRDSGFHTQHQA